MDKHQQNQIKVAFLTSSYPRTPDDSASVFLRYLAERLHKLNINIHVLAPADTYAGISVENEVTVHRFKYFPHSWQKLTYGSGILSNLKRNPLLWLQIPFFILAMAYALLRIIRQLKPDIIHAHWILPQGLIALVIAKYICRIPVIITVHGGDAFALRNCLFQRIKRFCLQKCTAWTSNTQATARAIGIQLPSLPHIIPMGVEIQHFESGRRSRLRMTNMECQHVILFVGRLVEKKGVADLIAAFALLPEDLRLQTQLWIIGDGNQRHQLTQAAKRLGILDNTKFFGFVPNHELPDYYSAADLFVAPSVVAASGDTEGQGVVLLEAFAAKTCVLATKVGGICEVVEDEITGLLVEPQHPSELALKIEHLLRDPALRHFLASNAYMRVIQSYSWEKIAQRFQELYQSILTP